MFAITIPVQELADELRLAEEELLRAEPIILRRVAERLVELLEKDFATKSSGGSGAGGVSWKRDKESPSKAIGVETGEMRRRLQINEQGTGLEVLFGTSWARHFDKSRTLIPDPLPKDWLEKLDAIAQSIAEDVVRDVLNSP